MAWRFNAPPGWPVPPDFVPPQGWVPDPAWPPAPAGWTYWVDAPGPTLAEGQNWGPPTDPYAVAPGAWTSAPTSKRGLPGWGIALIVIAIVGVLTVGALVVAAVVAIAPRLDEFAAEFDQEQAQFSASLACDSAGEAFVGASTDPDPVQASFQVRALEKAVTDATDAADLDPAYVPLREDLEDARAAARAIAALPVDTTTWTAAQKVTATAAQSSLTRASASIGDTCSTITDPWADEIPFGPTV